MDVILLNLIEAGYFIVALLLLYLAYRVGRDALRFGRMGEYIKWVVSLLFAASALALAGYVIWPEIPMSDKTIHRTGTRLGYEQMCKTGPQCTDCDSNSNCIVCESRSGCLDAVKKYANSCFNSYYNKYKTSSRQEFAILTNSCINKRSEHKYLRNMSGEG